MHKLVDIIHSDTGRQIDAGPFARPELCEIEYPRILEKLKLYIRVRYFFTSIQVRNTNAIKMHVCFCEFVEVFLSK